MVCGQCGDPLTKVPFIKPTQIFALIVSIAFTAQLLAMLISFNQNQNRPKAKPIFSQLPAKVLNE